MSMRAVLCCVVVVASACDGLNPLCETKTPLIDGEAWQFVPPDEDTMFPAPAGAELCDSDAVQRQVVGDAVAVEIDTRFGCGWATVQQPITRDVRAGEMLQVRVFYFSQSAFPEAEAAVKLALDGDVLLDARVTIPTSSGLIAPLIEAPRDVAAGALAHFHVGNHGDNSWNLVEFSAIGQGLCP